MTDLSDTQRLVLTAALEREDRCIYPIGAPLKGGAVGTVARSLLKRGLVEEVPGADGTTVWRNDEAGNPLTLRATELAQRNLAPAEWPKRRRRTARAAKPSVGRAMPGKRGAVQAVVVALLRRPQGVTNAEIQEATGWQPHSVRGALSGLIKKKLGHDVSSTKEERGRVYRIPS